jgi:hypothetical protein
MHLIVMAGLVPAIHAQRHRRAGFRGCPDQVLIFTHKSASDSELKSYLPCLGL